MNEKFEQLKASAVRLKDCTQKYKKNKQQINISTQKRRNLIKSLLNISYLYLLI